MTFTLNERKDTPWNQQCVKGKEVKEVNAEPAKQGPRADKPYFAVRMALPVPPAYTETELAQAVGIDWGVYHHHSPGFEVLPNGDALAVYFSSPRGVTETPF